MKVKELLTDADKWAKGYIARDKNNSGTSAQSEDAIKFCLVGAICKCYPIEEEKEEVLRKTFDTLSFEYEYFTSIAAWNDATERRFEEVKKLIETLDI